MAESSEDLRFIQKQSLDNKSAWFKLNEDVKTMIFELFFPRSAIVDYHTYQITTKRRLLPITLSCKEFRRLAIIAQSFRVHRLEMHRSYNSVEKDPNIRALHTSHGEFAAEITRLELQLPNLMAYINHPPERDDPNSPAATPTYRRTIHIQNLSSTRGQVFRKCHETISTFSKVEKFTIYIFRGSEPTESFVDFCGCSITDRQGHKDLVEVELHNYAAST